MRRAGSSAINLKIGINFDNRMNYKLSKACYRDK